MKKMFPNMFYIVAWTGIFLSLFIVIYLLYLNIYPTKIATVESPAKIVSEEIYQGGTVEYELDACIYTGVGATISKRFVNNVVHLLPEVDTVPEEGCVSDTVTTVVPEHLPPGKYIIEIVAVHHVNWLRDETVRWETMPFEVLPKK